MLGANPVADTISGFLNFFGVMIIIQMCVWNLPTIPKLAQDYLWLECTFWFYEQLGLSGRLRFLWMTS